ncbi:DUF1206 domain-containing protein [uncultured Kriegella sp.]|uniref:DUF1206 domain-containing protein n=1 Tax=uncultured Kriegella sp. TaxID=1798910 RepID=UPI0030D85B50
MKKSVKTTAIIGFISKGFIYLVIGLLTLLAALNMGGESSGTNQALKFLKSQPFGQVLLLVLGTGLLCYSYWMFVRCFKDPENVGNDKNGKMMRFGIFITGLVYTFLAFLCFYHLFTYAPEGSSGSRYINLLGPSLISILFIGIGVILVIQAIILIVGVIKGGLLDQFNLEGRKGSHIMRLVGKFGFISRAFIVGIIAYFFLRAGLYTGSHEIKGIQDAFSFLDQSYFGTVLMVFTSVGFISYGLFFIFLFRYRTFED